MPHRRNFMWNLIHVIVYLPLRCWVRTRVIGRENLIDESGGVLIAKPKTELLALSYGASFLLGLAICALPLWVAWRARLAEPRVA